MAIAEAELLWDPPEQWKEGSNIAKYMGWLELSKGLSFRAYSELWKWSVAEARNFWESVFEYFQIVSSKPYDYAVSDPNQMPGARWFPGAEVNYAEHVFRNRTQSDDPAILVRHEASGGGPDTISWRQLYERTLTLAKSLREELCVKRGDRIAAFIPNIPEAVIAFLACASLGAIWSSCSPDFGAPSVIDRFRQIEPKVLIAVDGSFYNGKRFDKMSVLQELQRSLPSLERTVLIPYLNEEPDASQLKNHVTWGELFEGRQCEKSGLSYGRVPFEHPLWILYSSGTTGLPKPLVHSQGGILLEHLKSLSFHNNLKSQDRFFWFTTTGWMMWNYLVGGLLVGSTIVLYDGSPAFPDMNALWDLAQESGITFFGTSAAYINSCMKAGIRPERSHDLERLVGVGSTGSPLSVDGFKWLYENVKKDLWVESMSGGTDVCTGWLAGCPLLPVTAGEIQCVCLGADVKAFNEKGEPVVNDVGELVVIKAMPSMPVFLWGDDEGRRYLESYFEMFPGVWRHGDWIKITDRGTCVIYGRSDSTIKRMGLRMGTSEIYRAVETLQEVVDSLVIDFEGLGGRSQMILFVVLNGGAKLDTELRQKIRGKISRDISPRYVPDEIMQIQEVPRTLNGKKMEVPIRKLLMGVPMEKALSMDSMSNSASVQFFLDLAKKR